MRSRLAAAALVATPVMDLTTLRYFFEPTTSPNVIRIDLTRLPLAPGNRVRTLDPDDVGLSGGVTDELRRSRINPL